MKPTFMKKDAMINKAMDNVDKGIMIHRHNKGKETSVKATMNKGANMYHTNTPSGQMTMKDSKAIPMAEDMDNDGD